MKLSDITLASGLHQKRGKRMCLMEAVAFLAKEPHSDRPDCVDRVLGGFARALNDAPGWSSDAKRTEVLRPLAKKLIDTIAPFTPDDVADAAETRELERRRAHQLMAWCAAEPIASIIDKNGGESAAGLMALTPQSSKEEVRSALFSAVVEYWDELVHYDGDGERVPDATTVAHNHPREVLRRFSEACEALDGDEDGAYWFANELNETVHHFGEPLLIAGASQLAKLCTLSTPRKAKAKR